MILILKNISFNENWSKAVGIATSGNVLSHFHLIHCITSSLHHLAFTSRLGYNSTWSTHYLPLCDKCALGYGSLIRDEVLRELRVYAQLIIEGICYYDRAQQPPSLTGTGFLTGVGSAFGDSATCLIGPWFAIGFGTSGACRGPPKASRCMVRAPMCSVVNQRCGLAIVDFQIRAIMCPLPLSLFKLVERSLVPTQSTIATLRFHISNCCLLNCQPHRSLRTHGRQGCYQFRDFFRGLDQFRELQNQALILFRSSITQVLLALA